MKEFDLQITIQQRKAGNDYYRASCKSLGGKKKSARMNIPIKTISKNITPDGQQLGKYLYELMRDCGYADFITILATGNQILYPFNAVLMDIKAPELLGWIWEDAFDAPELAGMRQFWKIVRSIPSKHKKDMPALTLPIDVLLSIPAVSESNIGPTIDSLQYFNVQRAIGNAGETPVALMQHQSFDIIHMAGTVSSETDQLFFQPAGSDIPISIRQMVHFARKAGTRLIVLQCINADVTGMLAFAHKIARAKGPVILVVGSTAKVETWTFDSLYFNIVHDTALDVTFFTIPRALSPAIFLPEGKENSLLISPLAYDLEAAYKKMNFQATHLSNLIQTILENQQQMKPKVKTDNLVLHYHELNTFMESTGSEVHRSFNYDRETGGMEPLKNITTINKDFSGLIKKVEAATIRVVNCWFRDGKERLDTTQRLETSHDYTFELYIGIAVRDSILKAPVGIPEVAFKNKYTNGFLLLKCMLFSEDLEIPVHTQELRLPEPPGETDILSFAVKTGNTAQIANMRAGIYYENNLVQTLMVQAVVGEAGIQYAWQQKGAIGNFGVVDYSLSNNFSALERLPRRTLNIAVNEDSNGTHSLYIAGRGLKKQLVFGESEIRSFIDASRQALQLICGGSIENGARVPYQFLPDNSGNEQQFITAMLQLADVGYKLYVRMMTSVADRAFRAELQNALREPGAVIQVASTASAKNILPWALLYDKPLESGNNKVCPQFLEDLRKGNLGGSPETQTCIVNGCAHTEENIICPSGFWGFKHIIEQPLSVRAIDSGTASLPLKIQSPASASVLMCVSRDLQLVDAHIAEVKKIQQVNLIVQDSKELIKAGIKRNDLQVIYFYCHGGRTGPDVWLGVGKAETIDPTDLFTWDPQWQPDFPFVFVNGCHTTSLSPDDFVAFKEQFALLQAAGLMGTEITITEGLATCFANAFLPKFIGGTNVGKALRDQRLAMLKIYNPLGLAFTPFCSAALSIVH